jgi:hypothetical protein
VLDGEPWFFAEVYVPKGLESELKEHFEVSENIRVSERLGTLLSFSYSELLKVKDVISENKDRMKRIFELINKSLSRARYRTINEYEKIIKEKLLNGEIDELEEIFEKRVKKIRKEAERREKRLKALKEVKYKVVETPVGYLYAGFWSLQLIREEDDDIVLYDHRGSESEIAQKVYSIRNGRMPVLNIRISFKDNPDIFKHSLDSEFVKELKEAFPEMYLKLKLLGIAK